MQTEKEKFIEWLTKSNYAQSSIKVYSGKIDTISDDLKSKGMLTVDSLYGINNTIELEDIYNKWISVPEFKQKNDTGNNQASCGLKLYVDFRKDEQTKGIINKEEQNKIEPLSQEIIDNKSYLFALESHLQDFLIGNLQIFKHQKLKLFTDLNGRMGKEYPTADGGSIDILTVDEKGNFFVFELKLARGVDKTIGQLQRYMGWVKKDLANGKEVFGIIVANKMDDRIKYAVAVTQNITLYEYEMKFELKELPN